MLSSRNNIILFYLMFLGFCIHCYMCNIEGRGLSLEKLFTTSSGIRIHGVCSRPYLLREGKDHVKIHVYTSVYSLERTYILSVSCNWTSGLFAWTVIETTVMHSVLQSYNLELVTVMLLFREE